MSYEPSALRFDPNGYWMENSRTAMIHGFAKPGSLANMPRKDMAIYGASAVVGALIVKSFIAGPLGLLLGAAGGLMGASAAIKGR